MEIGVVGVGKMGLGIVRRLQAQSHTVHAYDADAGARAAAAEAGATVSDTLEQFVVGLNTPRVLWLMLPAGEAVRTTMQQLAQQLDSGDTVLDGGNSFFKDSQHHAARMDKHGIRFLDVGVSGGVVGEKNGYALMIGGAADHVVALAPLFDALAAPQAATHVGPAGAGHFVKMVHNAIEYGMMQAIAEGFDLLRHGPFTELDLAKIAGQWNRGTIIRSFLVELTAAALTRDQSLKDIAPYIDDSGEGRWSVATAVEHAVPFWVNTAALYARFDSRVAESFSAKLVAALRHEFGGHAVKSASHD